eukprot:scpid7233/ scgid34825/ Aminopeptidase O
MVLVSTHASSQGQVFACTPSHLSASHGGFEEFCSLDNLVLTAQDSLGCSLVGVHCSACFLMRLDSSHKNWPCSVSWVQRLLQCTVTGSRGEIFETGSQVADLLVLLLTTRGLFEAPPSPMVQTSAAAGAAKKRKTQVRSRCSPYSRVLAESVRLMRSQLSQNLAHEMRLVQLEPSYVRQRISIDEDEAEVHPRPLLSSRVSPVLLTTDACCPAEAAAVRLAEAISVNMAMRSDVQSCVHSLTVPVSCTGDASHLRKWLSERFCEFTALDQSYYFIVLSPALCGHASSVMLEVKVFQDWLHSRRTAQASRGVTGQDAPAERGSSSPGVNVSAQGLAAEMPRAADGQRCQEQTCGSGSTALQTESVQSKKALCDTVGVSSAAGATSGTRSLQSAVPGPTLPRRCVYGLYFQQLSPRLFNECSNVWRDLQAQVTDIDLCSLPVVTCVRDSAVQDKFSPCHQFPLLLYLLHLSVGENCIPLTTASTLPYRPSRWVLERVYTEVVMMLTGLAQHCNLTLFSPSPIAIADHCLRYELPAELAMKQWASGLVCCRSDAALDTEHPYGCDSDAEVDENNMEEHGTVSAEGTSLESCTQSSVESSRSALAECVGEAAVTTETQHVKLAPGIALPSSVESTASLDGIQADCTKQVTNTSSHAKSVLTSSQPDGSTEEQQADCTHAQLLAASKPIPKTDSIGGEFSCMSSCPLSGVSAISTKNTSDSETLCCTSTNDSQIATCAVGDADHTRKSTVTCSSGGRLSPAGKLDTLDDCLTADANQGMLCNGNSPIACTLSSAIGANDSLSRSLPVCSDGSVTSAACTDSDAVHGRNASPAPHANSPGHSPHCAEDAIPPSDLPVSSNWSEVHVKRYHLDWTVDFDSRLISGYVELCIDPAGNNMFDRPDTHSTSALCSCPNRGILAVSEVVLDHRRLNITKVSALVHAQTVLNDASHDTATPHCLASRRFVQPCASNLPAAMKLCPVEFDVSEHFVRCSKPASMCCLPRHIRVHYSTPADSASLSWVKDADGRPCVYTRGSSVNHRELYPGQDTPRCASTWSARVCVPSGCTVLLSGDESREISEDASDKCSVSVYDSSMSTPFWCCVLAFMAGWYCETPVKPLVTHHAVDQGDGASIPMSLWTVPSLQTRAAQLLAVSSRNLFCASTRMLGRYPFGHMHLVVMPRSFGCLGLANPHMAFLSPSLLTDAAYTDLRVAHEFSHSWFGLDIGASIWTEEWLSEGFSTYCEDRIYTLCQEAAGGDAVMLRQLSDIRLRLKLNVLAAEVDHTDTTLQVLVGDPESQDRVVNALREEKPFQQVHYIKGYLLLCHMAQRVGVETFDRFLARVTEKFSGKNISSSVILNFFFEEEGAPFRSEEFCTDRLVADWLQHPGMPPSTHLLMPEAENQCLARVNAEIASLLNMIQAPGQHRKQHHTHDGRSPLDLSCFEVCWLLTQLVQADIKTLRVCCMRHIHATYRMEQRSAEERHIWCELIVKHRCQSFYGDVERFLREDQGMGVYLYGELILTRQKKAQKLAVDVFQSLQEELDEDARKVVQGMLEPLLDEQ